MSVQALGRYVHMPVRTWNLLESAGLRLPPSAPALYMRLATAPEGTRLPGVIRIGLAALAEVLGWSAAIVRRLAADLTTAGLLLVDWEARLIYLPALLKEPCSRPNSPSSAAVFGRELADLPRCELLERIDRDLKESLSTMTPAFLESYSSCKRVGESKKEAPQPARPSAVGSKETSDPSLYSALLSSALDPKGGQAPKSTDPGEEQASFELAPQEQPASKEAGRAKEIAAAIMHYRSRWSEVLRTGDKKPVLDKADRGQLAAMLRIHGLEEWKRLLERYLRDQDPFVVKNGYALANMTRRINGYVATAPKAAEGRYKSGDELARQFSREKGDGL